jgi:hypothetical protein
VPALKWLISFVALETDRASDPERRGPANRPDLDWWRHNDAIADIWNGFSSDRSMCGVTFVWKLARVFRVWN